jgi:Uma2 family endonuclease
MPLTTLEPTQLGQNQMLVLPGRHNWSGLQSIQAWAATIPGLRVTYLDGYIQLMTTGKLHERIKKLIAILLEIYFFEQGIQFFPAGNATCEAEEQGVSFEPDESYCLGTDQDYPNLAIEVIITSGGLDKLEKYRRFEVDEVWFWQDNQLLLYGLVKGIFPEQNAYERLVHSQLLPELNLAVFSDCIQLPDILEARRTFLAEVRTNSGR